MNINTISSSSSSSSSSIISPFDKLIFPAPSISYDCITFDKELIWVPSSSKTYCTYIPCLFLPHSEIDDNNNNNKNIKQLLILYAHGNACDIGDIYLEMIFFRLNLKSSILAFEFPGYGLCDGSASESSVNNNLLEVFDFAIHKLKYPVDNILLFGRSIGTGSCVALASALCKQRIEPAGLILQSPYLSIKDVAKNLVGFVGSVVSNRWNSKEEITHVTCPVLFIHGVLDKLIPFEHSKQLYDLCSSSIKELVLLNNSDHNEFELNWAQEIIKFVSFYCTKKLHSFNQISLDENYYVAPKFAIELCNNFDKITSTSNNNNGGLTNRFRSLLSKSTIATTSLLSSSVAVSKSLLNSATKSYSSTPSSTPTSTIELK